MGFPFFVFASRFLFRPKGRSRGCRCCIERGVWGKLRALRGVQCENLAGSLRV